MESGLGPGKSWKINQMVAIFLPHVLVLAFIYIFWITAFTNWTVHIVDYQFQLIDLPDTSASLTLYSVYVQLSVETRHPYIHITQRY